MKITSRKKKITIFDIVIYFIAAFLFLIVAYPLILVVSCSISDPGLVATGQVLFWPKGINMEGYKQLLNNPNILIGYGNTIFYTVFGTLVNLAVTIPAGYVLSKTMVPGTKLFTGLFMFTMYFSGGMIPTFLLVNKLGLYNTRAVLLILGAFSTYNCIICRSFFVGLPTELEESVSKWETGQSAPDIGLLLPLSKALLGVMVLYFGVAHWNGYFNAMIYINEDVKQPLQVFLRRILVLAQISANMDEAGDYAAHLADMEALIRYAVIVVSSAPLLILYPFLQKYFDKGVLIGSVKG